MPISTFTFFFLFLLVAMAISSSFCFEGLDMIQLAQNQIVQFRNKLSDHHHEMIIDDDYNVYFKDCVRLYSESEFRLSKLLHSPHYYTTVDTRTWLSGVLANHRTCLEGLAVMMKMEKYRFLGNHILNGNNLTFWLSDALAWYEQEERRGLRKGVPRRPIFHDGGLLTSWNPTTSKADYVVAKDGSGIHKTINEALAALNRNGRRSQRTIIYVKAGVYNEKVEIEQHNRDLMFVGDGIGKTIITGSRSVRGGDSTSSSATFGVSGDGFWARDITFENTAGPEKHQAVALRVTSDLSIFYRCSFRAYQDTLLVHSLRQFYRDCQIYGTIDFIFGDAAVVFQNCDIFIRRPMDHQANFITAQGRDDRSENTGISIQRSRVRPAPEFIGVKDSFKSFLGRPWKKYSRTVFMETDLDGLIDPSGWGKWDGDFALSTLFYAEYMNIGNGASTRNRVKWPGFHVLNSPEEARPFSVEKFIQGDMWIPQSGAPCWFDI